MSQSPLECTETSGFQYALDSSDTRRNTDVNSLGSSPFLKHNYMSQFSRLGIQVSLAIYMFLCLARSWLGWLPFFSFLFSYASVLNTCISMYIYTPVCVIAKRISARQYKSGSILGIYVCTYVCTYARLVICAGAYE